MNRRVLSVLLAGFSVSVATGAAIALGNSVSTTPEPAFVRSAETESESPSTTASTGTTSITGTTPSTGRTTTTGAPATTVTTFDDHGSGGHGADDPATHDVGDDKGGDRATTSTSTPSTTATTFDDHGGGDDSDNSGSGSSNSGSGSGNSGRGSDD